MHHKLVTRPILSNTLHIMTERRRRNRRQRRLTPNHTPRLIPIPFINGIIWVYLRHMYAIVRHRRRLPLRYRTMRKPPLITPEMRIHIRLCHLRRRNRADRSRSADLRRWRVRVLPGRRSCRISAAVASRTGAWCHVRLGGKSFAASIRDDAAEDEG